MATRRLIIGCGYLGRRVGARWLAAGDRVQALTRSAARATELRALGFEPCLGDVLEPGSLASLPEVESILYAVGLDRSAGRSQREVYVDGLRNVLSVVAPRAPQFVYISSTSVYGQNAGEWVDENSPCAPETPNGQVCLEAERLLKSALPTGMILRLAGLYGPGRLIARVEQLRQGDALTGNPEAWLNLIHIDDAVRVTLACAADGRPGVTYLGCDGHPIRRREYYAQLAALVGAPAPRFVDNPLDTGERQHVNKRCRSVRLQQELRVELQYPEVAAGLSSALSAEAR